MIKAMTFRNRAETLRWIAQQRGAATSEALLDHAAGLDLQAKVEERRERAAWLLKDHPDR